MLHKYYRPMQLSFHYLSLARPSRWYNIRSVRGVNLVWNLGGRGSWSKYFPFSRQIWEKFRFFQAISNKKFYFPGKFLKNFNFLGNFPRKFDFPEKNWPFIATSGQMILLLLKSHHFWTYFLYIIRYNNISRPVHDTPAIPYTSLHDPQPK